METVSKMKYSRTDRLVLGIGYAILGLFVLSIVVPLVYVVLASFMDPTVLNNQGLSFHIKDWTLDAYRRVLEKDQSGYTGFRSTVSTERTGRIIIYHKCSGNLYAESERADYF